MNSSDPIAKESYTPAPALRLDWLLRFDPWVAERHERERGAERVRVLRHLTYIALVLYNSYNLTGIFLMPDILGLSIVLRSIVVTPASLLLCWVVAHVGERSREWLVTAGLVNAFAIPAFLFWLTKAPLGGYVFAEITLVLIFGNMLLLRFPHAIVYTASTFVISAAVALTKAGLADGLRAAFVLQSFTACVWSLYANYRSEAVRCRGYLEELRAILKSEASDAASSRFLDLSMTDALTGLPNRRALDQTVARLSCDGAALAVVMIDVDHFKLFNDTLGHPAGDECLRLIGAALSSATTGMEHFVARFGGEEFTVVAQDLGPFQAARLGKTLVEAVAALGLAHPGRTDGHRMVTISAGIALKPVDMDISTVFKAADAALYEAKGGGRNRYVVANLVTDLAASVRPRALANPRV